MAKKNNSKNMGAKFDATLPPFISEMKENY